MTAYATRSPLQLLTNPHYVMAEQRQNGRRTSARLREKEDLPATNGIAHAQEKSKSTSRSGKTHATAQAAESRTRSKRKLEYDEEDDGFMFTRAKSKRTKAAPVSGADPPSEGVSRVSKPAPATKGSRKAAGEGVTDQRDDKAAAPRRRSARHSGEKMVAEPSELEIPKRRTKRAPREHAVNVENEVGDSVKLQLRHPEKAAQSRSHSPDPSQGSSDTTKIALPFADTPIIRRNKEMRKGSGGESRRSSLSNRGRRASSLIDSGTSNALPHHEVEASDFYKYIESGLLEPRRMRQLLIWCGTRALSEKPSFATEDGPTRLAAREIQQQLLKDFSSKSELSDWLSREESTEQPQPLKPNPKNIANLAKIEELELKLKQLQEERKTWETLLRPPANSLLPALPQELPSLSSIPIDEDASASIASLAAETDLLSEKLPNMVQERVRNVAQTVEDEIDKLVEGVNGIAQHLQAAQDVGRRCLGGAARILEGRSTQPPDEEGNVGLRDVLRGLSRVDER